MDLNNLASSIYNVIENKGFHSIHHSQLEALTFRQLLHIVTEWQEMYVHNDAIRISKRRSEHLPKLYEEGADILIVALDLAKMHGVDLSGVDLRKPVLGAINDLYLEVPFIVGRMGDRYRKEGILDHGDLVAIIKTVVEILRRHGADPIREIERKMEKNASREPRWGTAHK